jgi:hypothetical protein
MQCATGRIRRSAGSAQAPELGHGRTEGRLCLRVGRNLATTVTDLLLRKALDMDSREELRILFFVNWAAWHRRNMPAWRRPWYRLKVLAGWIYLIWQRIGMARNIDARHSTRDANFTATGATVGVKLEPAQMIDLCLAENERRMSGYDNRLLRPNTVPFLARLARRFL